MPPDNESPVIKKYETHIAQYTQFKETCLEAGVAPSEILPLWHTYQLNMNVRTLHEIDFKLCELKCSVDNHGHPPVDVETPLDRIATAIECR